MNKIYFILTGGTIDSTTTGQDRDTLLKISAVPEYFQSLGMGTELEFAQICMKDSRDVTENDRKKILQEVEGSLINKIIITHGTFTMVQTAQFLEKELARKDQTVILTGSLIPLVGFKNSDAPFNLKYAVKQASALSPGVYVCMNECSFPAQEAAKDENTGKFYSKLVV